MLKIIVDTMGGDNGSSVVVDAIINFLNKNKDVEIVAVGKQEELTKLEGLCRIIDARDIVPMEAGPMEVMRMRNSSMVVAVKTFKEEQADAVISCGSTGGFLSASTITLKTIPGVKRACLCTAFPTKIKGKKVTMLDIGASNENNAEELFQFAIMGRAYSQAVFGVEQPKVYLLCNGTEEKKGSPVSKEAFKLLQERNFPGFMGNLEGREIMSGDADVVVCDGFTGNCTLKAIEGVAKMLGNMMKGMFKKNLWTKLGYLHVRGGVKEITETMDYKSVGGALLLGVNGVAMKAHGNSDAYSFESALKVVKSLASYKLPEKIKEGIENA